jgi:hypothetical protein
MSHGASPYTLSLSLAQVWACVGRLTADLVFNFWNGMIFAGVWLLFGHSGQWSDWIAVIVGTSFASGGVGYLCAASMRPGIAGFISIILVFFFSVFRFVSFSVHLCVCLTRHLTGISLSLFHFSLFFCTQRHGAAAEASDQVPGAQLAVVRPETTFPLCGWFLFHVDILASCLVAHRYLSFATHTSEATYYTWTKYLDNGGRIPDGAQVRPGYSIIIIIIIIIWERSLPTAADLLLASVLG